MPAANFTLMDIFLNITRLSYMGDVRMNMKAENPNKIWNIVEPNFNEFLEYYQKYIDMFEEENILKYKGQSIFTLNSKSRDTLAKLVDW